MAEKQTATWKIALGYASFSVAAFVFFFYVTFPFGAIRERITGEAAAQGYELTMSSLGPGLFGVTAKGLEIKSKAPPGMDGRVPEAVMIDSLALRPSVFPLGLAFRANAFGGTATGAVGGIDTVALRVNLDELDLSQGNLKGFTGMNLSGLISGNVDLEIPKTTAGNVKGPAEPDLGAASGVISLKGEEVTINGGTVTVPYMGQPTPMDLPKIIIGALDAQLTFEKGQGKIDAFSAKSTDLQAIGTGTLKLAKRFEYAEPNLELRYKIEDDLKKRLGPLSMGVSMLPSDPKDPTFKLSKVTGFLGRPNFR